MDDWTNIDEALMIIDRIIDLVERDEITKEELLAELMVAHMNLNDYQLKSKS